MKGGVERGNLYSIVLAGSDICTMPFGVFQQLIKHPLTDLGVKKFLETGMLNSRSSQRLEEEFRYEPERSCSSRAR